VLRIREVVLRIREVVLRIREVVLRIRDFCDFAPFRRGELKWRHSRLR
jgi:hypothetical protein